MKKYIFALLTSIFFLSTSAYAVEQNIHLEWTYDDIPIDGKIIEGYNLYMEGNQVCTTDPEDDITSPTKIMDCIFEAESGTFNFTLTTLFSDGSESPHSPPYQFNLGEEPDQTPPLDNNGSNSFTFRWEANQDINTVSGYQIYLNNTKLCSSSDPTSNEITCYANTLSTVMDFTMTTLFSDNTESAPSNLLRFDPTTYPQFSNTKLLTFFWTYPDDPTLSGFKIYQNGVFICESSNPADRQISCTTELTEHTESFAITAVKTDQSETLLSNTLSYTTGTPVDETELLAKITTDVTQGAAPLTVSFNSASSTGNIISYAWSFADGSTSETQNVSHQYTIPGTYNVLLTVTDNTNNTSSATISILVTEGAPPSSPPIASISSSTSLGDAPLDVSFSAEGSSAPGSTITLYHWDFGDGTTSTGLLSSHKFTTPGSYTTRLTVTNSDGLTSFITTPVLVTAPPEEENVPPKAVINATPGSGNVPLTVIFSGSGSTDEDGDIHDYSWQFGDGTSGNGINVTHTYTTSGTFGATLVVTDDDGARHTANAPITIAEANNNDFAIELGEVSINNNWAHVEISTSFVDPIVIAGPPSSADAEPCVIRLQNTSPTGFDIKLAEWDYLDGTHPNEIVSYIVMEKGRFTLADGTQVEAGSLSGTTKSQQHIFIQTFNTTPVVVTTVASDNETDTITGRIKNVSLTSFDYYFQEQEDNINKHLDEIIHFIAWEQGAGTLDTLIYEAQATANEVTNNLHSIMFQSDFNTAPLFFSDMQTLDGRDTSSIGYQNPTTTSIQVNIKEEQSKDDELGHTSEIIGYLAIGSSEPESKPEIPTIGNRAFTFNWSYDDTTQNLTGFKFYQNNQLFCEQTNATARTVDCVAPLLDTEVQFSMTAIIDGSETEPSNLLQVSADLFKRKATFTWTFDQQQETSISGFRIYADDTEICTSNDPTARTTTCIILTPEPNKNTNFTVRAIQLDDTKTDASNIITY